MVFREAWRRSPKRTVLNQLVGYVAFTAVINSLFVTGLLVVRLAGGPFKYAILQNLLFTMNPATGIMAMLAFDEVLIIRFCSITVWKRLPPVDDNFFGLFLGLLNSGLGLAFAIWGRLGYRGEKTMFFFLTGRMDMSTKATPFFRL